MKILAIEREVEGVPPDAFAPHLRAEAQHLWNLRAAGVVRETYFRADRHDAVLVLECVDAAEAAAVLDTLPLVREGLIRFEVIPLAAYTGFERLFGNG